MVQIISSPDRIGYMVTENGNGYLPLRVFAIPDKKEGYKIFEYLWTDPIVNRLGLPNDLQLVAFARNEKIARTKMKGHLEDKLTPRRKSDLAANKARNIK